MSSTPRDPSAVPDGIHDTGDLRRIWDALEQLADQVDAHAPDDPVDPQTPADGAHTA